MQTRKRFTKEFKLEAVRLLESGDISPADLARDLDVRRNQLYKWQAALSDKGAEAAFNGPGRNAAKESLSEVALLKRRVAQLEEENVILKKAAVYFAKELD